MTSSNRSGADDADSDDADSDRTATRRRAAGVPTPADRGGRDGDRASVGGDSRTARRSDSPADGPPPHDDDPLFEEPDASPLATRLGDLGVYAGLAAVGFALLGVVLGLLGAGVLTNVAFVCSLGLATVSMILGAVFQVSASGLPFR